MSLQARPSALSRRRLAAVAGPMLVVVHLGLATGASVERVRRVAATLARLSVRLASVGVAADRPTPSAVGRTVELTAEAAPWPLAGRLTCLRVAVVTHALCMQFGIDTDVQFGVRRDAGGFEAHAWVEHEGHVVAGALPDLDEYAELAGGTTVFGR